ncbi:hypothetical protein ACFORH_34850 [Amycolatopsis roodepoortensis]|uniref:Uncharacterized protein n=1 Tax=Amycolatopsis roodepoortensis TaxID=700274 RepID=A0ABR9L104_9PSEU|nr:hypothetical protein [Amycolatopsis roodepoortensis]MBE1574307.1 hypothetical protein [Amycolatopsis roodepoortensis]
MPIRLHQEHGRGGEVAGTLSRRSSASEDDFREGIAASQARL